MNDRLEQLQNLLIEDPNDVFIQYAIALEFFKVGHVDNAIKQLLDIIASHENYIPAYFRLGQWYAEQDNISQAVLVLNKGLDLAKIQQDSKAMQEIKELLLFIEDYEN